MLRNTARFAAAKGPQANPFAKEVGVIKADGADARYFKVNEIGKNYDTLPFSIRVLYESAVRNCDEFDITSKTVADIDGWSNNCKKDMEIAFKPSRVVLQDFTGVPCVVDLATMRAACKRLGGDPMAINPVIPVDLVVDHSIQVDYFGDEAALKKNQQLEMERNKERFQFLKWGSGAFDNLQIVPPGSGIVHQVNLEYLARVVFNNNGLLYPDSVVGTDSHTTMINGIGVAGWGVGGIEAEAAMLGQSLSLVLPKVVGYRFTGKMREGCTATDLVLTVVKNLRKHGVVGKFVEFYGDGLDSLSLSDRATISNMAPEYGATVGYFPIDNETISYLRCTGRTEEHIQRIEQYAKAAHMFRTGNEKIQYTENIELDLSTVEPSVSGPKRPHDHVPTKDMPRDFAACLGAKQGFKGFGIPEADHAKVVHYKVDDVDCTVVNGSVVIAAITSCTNTSNPSVLVSAGLVAKKARALGLTISPSVKTSLSPGSHVVTKYLMDAGLQEELDAMGFNTTGYGCMTCIGNSGEIHPAVAKTITDSGLVACAVLSGNRNFEARIHPQTAGNYLASPPLVVAYAIAGRMNINWETEPIGKGPNGDVFLKDIWPTNEEVATIVKKVVTPKLFKEVYETIKFNNEAWNNLSAPEGKTYTFDAASTYIADPPFCSTMAKEVSEISSKNYENAACLAYFGDSVTTDHISPAGNIAKNSPAARFLTEHNVERRDFNTYGSRRGNDNIMVRGTFANTRLGNKIIGEGQTGPVTIHHPTGESLSIFDAAMRYKTEGTPLIILAGKEYGSGSSRDWAAKGPHLLGVKVVIAESFERIHRSNLVGMGIVPLAFKQGESAATHGLTGKERFTFAFSDTMAPGDEITVTMDNGKSFTTILRIDTLVEMKFYRNGGILPYVVREKIRKQ